MLKILDRYLIWTMMLFIIVAALFVLSIDLLFALVRELKSVGHANYNTGQAILHVLLTTPRRLYNIFPMAALLGAVMGLGMLAGNRELLVMRASGMSLYRISAALLSATLILTIGVTAIGEWVLPHSEFAAKSFKAQAKGHGKALFTAQDSWLKDGSRFIHIDHTLPDGRLANVVRFEFVGSQDNRKLERISEAKYAEFVDDHWELQDVSVTIFYADHTATEHLDQSQWHSQLDAQILEVLVREPENLSIRELSNYQEYLTDNKLDAEQYQLSFWKKILQPLSTLVIVFIAIPCVFGPLRDTSMGKRLLAGILLGFGYYVTNELFAPVVLVYDWPPFLAAVLPMLVFALIGQQMLRRV